MVNFPGISNRCPRTTTTETTTTSTTPTTKPKGGATNPGFVPPGFEHRNPRAEEAGQNAARNGINARAPERAAKDVLAGTLDAEGAIARAEMLAESGNTHDGGRLLARCGDAFLKQGNFEAALQCYEAMKKSPFARTNTNITPEIEDPNAAPVLLESYNTNFSRIADQKIAKLERIRGDAEVGPVALAVAEA